MDGCLRQHANRRRRCLLIVMKNEPLWSIILAGGDGQRIRPFIEHWLGCYKPKQYCRFVGTRSLFQHTIDRADQLTPAERRVTVIACSHKTHVQMQLSGRRPGWVTPQPVNCGTAAGIFLPLCHAYESDSSATVVIYPSDHFIYPEPAFIEAVDRAVAASDKLPGRVLLLGAVSDRAEPEYGWILPGQEYPGLSSSRVHRIGHFLEKPQLPLAIAAMEAGGLWNTLILIAKAAVLWNLGWRLMPDVMARFERIRKSVGTTRERAVIEEEYRTMPVRDFSSHVLQRAPKDLAVMELRGIYWSDWGRPERIAATLKRIGKKPLFPPEALVAS